MQRKFTIVSGYGGVFLSFTSKENEENKFAPPFYDPRFLISCEKSRKQQEGGGCKLALNIKTTVVFALITHVHARTYVGLLPVSRPFLF